MISIAIFFIKFKWLIKSTVLRITGSVTLVLKTENLYTIPTHDNPMRLSVNERQY
jgi:hypothetical protein